MYRTTNKSEAYPPAAPRRFASKLFKFQIFLNKIKLKLPYCEYFCGKIQFKFSKISRINVRILSRCASALRKNALSLFGKWKLADLRLYRFDEIGAAYRVIAILRVRNTNTYTYLLVD